MDLQNCTEKDQVILKMVGVFVYYHVDHLPVLICFFDEKNIYEVAKYAVASVKNASEMVYL